MKVTFELLTQKRALQRKRYAGAAGDADANAGPAHHDDVGEEQDAEPNDLEEDADVEAAAVEAPREDHEAHRLLDEVAVGDGGPQLVMAVPAAADDYEMREVDGR